jgi:hypothetical protein
VTEAVFSRIVDASQVEQAVIAHLGNWMPTYLAEAERQRGIPEGSLPAIRSYDTVNQWQHWPENQLPACLVVSPGTVRPPKKEGDGTYRGFFAVGLGIVCSADNQQNTNQMAKLYTAVARAVLLQHQRLGDFDAAGVEWREEKYNDIPQEAARTLAAGQAIFIVEVPSITTAMSGPAEPYEDPYTDPSWPTIQESTLIVEEMT